ncbi:MAG: TlyA family RNA methyltransferase [Myxococcales bacterium]|nr:TlyA family RNA methyltransferase [Polyangiaceae bacterium]MDW8249665.1 TlyA family RNA methyltransferase [Myxococcales bacterium]
MKKSRVDVLLVERGLVESRTRAQALLIAGRVYSGEQRIDKPGTMLSPEVPLSIRGDDNPFVSRGGLKLAGALETFAPLGLDPRGKVAVDVGASTGGFTDCLLQRGATRVHAIDVGWGQIHPKLRADPRVDVRERTNAKTLQASDFPDPIDLIVVDASFIGLGSLAAALAATVRPGGELCAMIKPQFEAGREEVRRGRGVIRDEGVRQGAIRKATSALVTAGFLVVGECDAPLAGPKGNLERFVYARRPER